MLIDIKKIFLVIILSSIVGLIFNYLNPAGISLIREEKKLSMASDSLITTQINDDEKETTDTVEITLQSEDIEDEQELFDELNDTMKIVESSTNEKIINDEEEREEESITEPKVINLDQAFALFNNGAKFIDAREDFDYNAGHISNSINIYYYSFEENESKLVNINKDETIVTYCGGTDCDLSVMLGYKLTEIGYKNVYVFFGGWLDWVDANYPTNKI